jgi:uncharacterized membrane protein YkvA (DUF1232 family)
MRRRMALMALFRLLRPGTPGLGQRLSGMILATLRREYDGAARLGMIALSVLYLLSPLDFVADAVFLIVGVIGDAALITWVAGALMDETERFLEWERRQERIGNPARTTRRATRYGAVGNSY